MPASFQNHDPRIRRLFADCRAAVVDYFRKTNIFPITHVVVMREALAAEHPWLSARLVDAFENAETACRKAYSYPKRLALPTAVLVVEEEDAAFGKEPFRHGLNAQNRLVLEKFIQYAHEQGYISRRPTLSEMFAASGN